MWFEILCGIGIYALFKRFFYEDDTYEVETSDVDAKFHVGSKIDKLYGGNVYLGLRIPDPDTGLRQNIDIVLLTKKEAIVINVQNITGPVKIEADGSWICTPAKTRTTQKIPDPVAETRRQVAILESYLEQRGVALPQGYFSVKVVLPNPTFCSVPSVNFPPEVIPFDEWIKLKPELKNMLSGWIKDTFRGGKKEMGESIQQQLHFILSTAPKWDRLELKENKNVLGEFLDFDGKSEDIHALRNIKRTKVSRLVVQKMSMLGVAKSTLQVLYCDRDYRNGEASVSDWKEVQVRAGTKILFQPQNSSEVRKFKLSHIVSMSLSA